MQVAAESDPQAAWCIQRCQVHDTARLCAQRGAAPQLAGGMHIGEFGHGQRGEEDGRRTSLNFRPANYERAEGGLDATPPIASARGVAAAQSALARLLRQPQVTSVITGARRPERLADNLAAAQVALSADELGLFDAASRLPAQYPGSMFERRGKYRRKQLREGK